MRGDRIRESASIEITDLTEEDVSPVLAALSESFDGVFDHDWFEWKHRSGPWGASPGWVARDEEGLVGVRLFLPWQFRDGNQTYRALRPCDTVTVARARGRGVFRLLTEHAISEIGTGADFLFNTPNDQSKPGYLKMGFVEWARVGQRVGFVVPKGVSLTDTVQLPARVTQTETDRTDRFLDWRYRRCPAHDYQVLALAQSDEPNGIVCRTRTWRRWRMLVVDECWGGRVQEKMLARAAAHVMGTPLIWTTDEFAHISLLSRPRASTVVTRFDLGETPATAPVFSVGDIESVL